MTKIKIEDQNLGLMKATSRPREEEKKENKNWRRNQEENKRKTKFKASSRYFLLALIFLVILKTWLWFLKALTWDLMLLLHAMISYVKVYGWLRHDKHDYGMK